MSVQDQGLEALRKAIDRVVPESSAEYYVKIGPTDGHPIIADGTFTFSGFRKTFLTTTMDVGDVAIEMPPVPTVDRNSISVANLSQTETVYIGNIDVTADQVLGTTSGHELPPNESFNLDIAADVILYARCESGKVARIKITETA